MKENYTKSINIRVSNPVFGQKTLKEIKSLNFFRMNISDNFESLISHFNAFSVRGSIDVLVTENQPGSGKIWTGSGA